MKIEILLYFFVLLNHCLKISFNEKVVNELVTFFNLRTSFDLFFRIGSGAIDNTQLKSFVSGRNNAIISG